MNIVLRPVYAKTVLLCICFADESYIFIKCNLYVSRIVVIFLIMMCDILTCHIALCAVCICVFCTV